MFNAGVLGGSEEELHGALHFERQIFQERAQDFGFVRIGQAPGALGVLGLLLAHAILAHDVLGELAAAERLLARVYGLIVSKHGNVHDVGSDIDQRDVLFFAIVGELFLDQFERGLHRIGFHVHDQGLQPRGLGYRHAVLHFFLARGGDQHLHLLDIGGRGADHLIVEIDLLQGEGNVLVGLGLDLDAQLVVTQAGRYHDLLGDHRRRGQRHRHVLGACGQFFPAKLDRLRHGLEVGDIAVDHRVLGQGFNYIALHAQRPFARIHNFDHLHGGRADVHPEKGRCFRLEYVKVQAEFPFELSPVRRDTYNLR